MPNWCYTMYVAEGPKTQLQKLYDTMNAITAIPFPGIIENDFGSSWLGNLVMVLGLDPRNHSDFRCRGSFEDVTIDPDDGRLRFYTSTAWCEADDTRHLIEEKFPGVHLYFMSEEFGCGYWETNDTEGKYFRDRFYFQPEDYLDDDNYYEYYETFEELLDAIEEATGLTGLTTFEECEKALENYRDGDYSYSLYRIKFENEDK